jgi:plastocyanin domain-containing protein
MKPTALLPLAAAALAGLLALPLAAAAQAKSKAKAGKAGPTLALAVTEEGFLPDKLTVKKGQTVTLVVTRKTDATCARDLVIDDPPTRAQLPLNQPVTVAFTPNKTGELRFGCAMEKMVGGVILVE